MTAAVGIEKMLSGVVAGLVGGLMPPSAIMVLASPIRSLVTIITEAPLLSASMAAEAPAPPPPMMRTSVV